MGWNKNKIVLGRILLLGVLVLSYGTWKYIQTTDRDETGFFEKRGDGAMRITNCYPKSCQNPVFSSDSSEILFTRFVNGYNKGPSELVILNLGTGKERVIVKADGDTVNVPFGSWIDGKITFASDELGTDELVVSNEDGSGLKQITTTKAGEGLNIEPVFNPKDISRVVFEHFIGNYHHIKLVDINTRKEFYLTHDKKYDDRLPSWSPDGKKILWQRTELGKDDWRIYEADIILGGNPRFLNVRQVSSGPDDTDNSWTWNGDILSSRTGDGSVPNIFLFSNGAWTRVTKSDKEDGAPSGSPDRKWIAFESHGGNEESSSDIWLIRSSEEEKKEIRADVLKKQRWVPKPTTSFEWQLSGKVDTSVDAEVYDIDLFDNNESIIDELHVKGRKVICYVNVGAWENWRPDKDAFPEEVMGKVYQGFEDENWLDIRDIKVLGPIMEKRFDLCMEKGFDAVEPDNIDAWQQDTGFTITYEDQLRYNIWLAEQAHKRGLSIGLKNDGDQAKDLLLYYDWALSEGCFADSWCEDFTPFIKSGKAVFMTEYTDKGTTLEQFCPVAKQLEFYGILKKRGLDAWGERCQ